MKASPGLVWLAILAIGLICGCSGSSNPVQPQDLLQAGSTNSTKSDSQHMLWGMWDICIDLATMTATIAPDRGGENHINVLPLITPPKCSDCFTVHLKAFDAAAGILDIDLTLRNKFAVDGYDVRGILFTDDLGHLLKNDDAWTALYDVPGGDTINPFVAFAKDDPQRRFPAKGEITETCNILIPNPPELFHIKFAVDASYPGNCEEPYSIENFTQSEMAAIPGSHGIVSVDVKSWQGDVSAVEVEASTITGEPFTSFSHQAGDIWSVDLVNNVGATSGDYPVKIIATSAGSGNIALYDYATIAVSEAGSGGWARTWGGSEDDRGTDIAIDGSGNIYVGGMFEGTSVDFNPDPVAVDLHSSNGMYDLFVSKYDSSGNFVWARTWGGSHYESGCGVAVDGSGNVYVTGEFDSATVDFDPDPIAEDLHSSNGWGDVFVSKFDSSGSFLWARTWGGSYQDFGADVATDGSGNVCVTGLFRSNSVDFNPDPVEVDLRLSNGNADPFLTRFDSSGNYLWTLIWGGSSEESGGDVDIDGLGNIYVSGHFFGTSEDFNPDPIGVDLHSSNGYSDVYISKFNSSGTLEWARTWGGTDPEYDDSIAVDEFGNVIVTGTFDSPSVDFDPDPDFVDDHTSNGGYDVFLSKFDTSGTFIWARTWGGDSNEFATGVAVDGSGNVYSTGWFNSDPVDFNPDPTGVDSHTLNGGIDIFLSKFDSTGNFIWARTWGGIDVDDSQDVGVDGSGNVYVAGEFAGDAIDFNPDPVAVDDHSSNGQDDAFLCKFMPDGWW